MYEGQITGQCAQNEKILAVAKQSMAAQAGCIAKDDRSPIARSIARLIDRLNGLEAISSALVERLDPVSRPAGASMPMPPKEKPPSPQCALDDEIETASMRIESVIERIEIARNRLCI